MPSLKPQEESLSEVLSPNIETELDRWQKLIFSFDMDEENSNALSHNNGSNPQRNSRSRSHSVNQQRTDTSTFPGANVQDAVLLAQFAAGAGLPQPQTHDPSYGVLLALLQAQNSQHSLTSLFQSGMSPQLYAQPQASSQHPLNFPPPHMQWPPAFIHQQQDFPYSQLQMPHHNADYTTLPHINTNVTVSSSSTPSTTNSVPPAASPAASPSSSDAGDPNVVEDKRRRNTMASARFRIKKKQRNLNLERTVSDLSGRADELEREASDLRRENGWLKEIVLLKGSRLAGLDVSPQTLPKPPTEGDISFWGPGKGSSSNQAHESDDSDSENNLDEEQESSKGRKATVKGKERQK